MKIYIKRHDDQAGKYIYKGFISAWKHFGYEVILFDDLLEINDSDYELMCLYSDVCNLKKNFLLATGKPQDWNNEKRYEILKKANKSYVWVQADHFPSPWGNHPNWACLVDDREIDKLNSIDNCHLWAFSDTSVFYNKLKNVNKIMLAFDSINYKNIKIESPVYDVCFIGGWANNGFNEKKKIMLEHFSKLKESNLKCGIFINKNLTHEQENHVLCNSKVALNIHDAYQKKLGLDSNERTFKSLGLTGALVCDNIAQVKNEFDNVQFYNNSSEIIGCINNFLQMSNKELENIKEINKNFILNNHTYINRVDVLRNL